MISHCDLLAWLFQTNLMHTFCKNKSVSEEVTFHNGSLEKMRRANAEFHKVNYRITRYGATPQNDKESCKISYN